MWDYKRTNKKFDGSRVYKKYQFDEFAGYCYKQRSKQLQSNRTLKGVQHKEANVGWEYPCFIRYYKNEKGNIIILSWNEFSKMFVTY